MKKPLASFRYATRATVAKLDGLKTIMRVTTPRKAEWYLVLPCIGEEDSVCVLLAKTKLRKFYRNQEIARSESDLLKEYASRIVA